jgi:hypothetical protein
MQKLIDLIDPRATFLVFFVIPMPAIAVVGLFAAYDIYKASTLEVSCKFISFKLNEISNFHIERYRR